MGAGIVRVKEPGSAWATVTVPEGGTGGPTALTDLTDVTGEPGPNKAPVYDAETGVAPLTTIPTQESLDAILASVAETVWFDLTLENGFEPYGDDWPAARCRLLLNNSVFLEGLVKRDTLDEAVTICVLPEEARPGANLMFVAPSSGPSTSRIDVYPDGTVLWAGLIEGSNPQAFVSLSSINFSTG